MPHIQIKVDDDTLDTLVRYAAHQGIPVEDYAAKCLRFMAERFGRKLLNRPTSMDKALSYGMSRLAGDSHRDALKIAGIDGPERHEAHVREVSSCQEK